LLAAVASDALRAARPLNGSIRHGTASVPIVPRAQIATESGDADSSGIVGDRVAATLSAGQQRIVETRQQGVAMLAALAALPEGAIADRCDLDVWKLGDLALVSVPAELFSSFGSQIASASDEPTLVLGYGNGYIGYLADRRAYEALASPYGPEAGEQVSAAATNLVLQLRSNRKPTKASV
jgi:hypothetical protein